MQRGEHPETLDMLEGLGPKDADYFAWRPSSGMFQCLACGQPCPNTGHLSTRHHYNNVWRWIERQRPQWTEYEVDERFHARTRNMACTYGWRPKSPPVAAWGPPPQLALPAPAPAPAQPQAPAPAAPPAPAGAPPARAAGAPPAPAGAQPKGGARWGAAPAQPPPPPPQQDGAATAATAAFTTMRDQMARQAKTIQADVETAKGEVATMRTELQATTSTVETIGGEVASMRTELQKTKSAVEEVGGEVASMKHELREFFEMLSATLKAVAEANRQILQTSGKAEKEAVTTKEGVETIKSDVEKIKRAVEAVQGDVQTMEAVPGNVQTIRSAVDKTMIDSQVTRQVLLTLQEEMVRLGRPPTPQMEQSVTQTVESSVQGEVWTVTQAVQSVKDDVEAVKLAVDAIRESLRPTAPRRTMSTGQSAPSSPNGVISNPNGIMRTSNSLGALQLPAVHHPNR